MIATRVISRKRDGATLTPSELEGFLDGFLSGEVADYQMSAFLMACFLQGLDAGETDTLVRAMLGSGATLDLGHLPGPVVDKHSTGGVGDKVSLVLAPVAAEMGCFVPMMSGRGLGHTAGTLDKLEAIPGFSTDVDLEAFVEIVGEIGFGMIGQTAEIAPLDKRLYALRDVTATVPSVPLIAASIMSKKLAEGLNGLLLDVKVGSGAFIEESERATELAEAMIRIGEGYGLSVRALLTAMDRPLGRAIGNGLETVEAIDCLRGEGPADLRELVVEQAAEMARLGGLFGSIDEAKAAAAHALDSGAALDRFGRLVAAQGGEASVLDGPERLRTAPVTRTVTASLDGTVLEIRPRPLGEGVVALGGGRLRVEDAIDPGVGFVLDVSVGDSIEVGRPLGVVHAADDDGAELGARVLEQAVVIGEGDPAPLPLVGVRFG